ncbi:TIGR04222 domain-containing membrane protein [Amycolatopsis sacchari]|uniref:TIGR04222 domain-containing membrane protein n=1 Tax=Amycolatopsis sacchari TaxID=115433 RepID=UPI003EBDFACE
MEPWGLSGPQFTGLYFAAVVAGILLTFLLRRRVARRPVPPAQSKLSLREAAYLAGGPRRVLDSAVATLLKAQRLRARRGGWLQAVGKESSEADLARAVYDHVREHGERSLRQVRSALRRHPEVRGTRASLVERGLIVPQAWSRALLCALPLLVVLGVGIARLVNGVRLYRPVGNLILLLVCAAIATFVALWPRSPWRSRAGAEVHTAMRSRNRSKNLPVRLPSLTGAAAAVAIGGIAAYPNQAIAQALGASSSSGSSGGDSSSFSSSCSSGSSCGGGGGCGG